MRVLEPERAAGSARQGAEVGAAPEPLPEVAGNRAYVSAGAAFHFQNGRGPGRVRIVPLDELHSLDDDGAGRKFGRRSLREHKLDAVVVPLDQRVDLVQEQDSPQRPIDQVVGLRP